MKILWAPNPLATVVELDEVEKRLLWHQLKIKNLEERMFTAHFDLDPIDREWHNKHVGERSLEAAVAAAIAALDVAYIDGDEKRRDKSYAEEIDKTLGDAVAALAGAHCGDCTCVPCGCSKCFAEGAIGIDTLAGLGKHEAHAIAGVFRPAPGEPTAKTISEALEMLRDHHPVKGRGWEKCTDEAFQAHVPRWIEEAKRAHTWLEAYRKEHSL
jgi:hypothetical protein